MEQALKQTKKMMKKRIIAWSEKEYYRKHYQMLKNGYVPFDDFWFGFFGALKRTYIKKS